MAALAGMDMQSGDDGIGRRREAWSAYWGAGQLHSCLGDFMEARDGDVVRFWREDFSRIPEGGRVLDLGTGNGALPKLLLELRGAAVAVDAVDLAELRPAWLAGHAQAYPVTFHSGVRMESLPFAAGTFDLVISQFGLEYARWPDALDEVARVCRPGGGAAFVMHHAGSLVVRVGREELAQHEFLRGEDGLIAAARAILPHVVRIASGVAPDAAAEQARKRYNEAMRRIGERVGSGDVPAGLLVEVREQVHGIVGGRDGLAPVARGAALERYIEALDHAMTRTRELLSAALDEARLERLLACLRGRMPGRRVEARPLLYGGDIIAWGVRACPGS